MSLGKFGLVVPEVVHNETALLAEIFAQQCLGEEVAEVLFRVDVFHTKPSILHIVANLEDSDVEVL